jgi:hypothetical protein
MSGQVQKGPLLLNSTVWIAEQQLLNSNATINTTDSNGNPTTRNIIATSLNPTGKTFITQTKDDLGQFALAQTVTSRLVEILATGYYMDELTGNLATAPITLKAVADLSVTNKPTVNILTTLQNPRLKALLLQGNNWNTAYTQSQTEVLAAFGIDSSKITSLSSLFAMKINGTTDQDAVLLALSSVLAKMSTTAAAANGSSQAAELSNYLVRIGAEIESSGQLTNAAIISARNAASAAIDLAAIKTNVETYYANKGVTVVTPRFEEWVDKDNSGVIPRRLVPVTGLSLTNVTNADAAKAITSSTITIGGIGSNRNAPASVSSSSILIKNGIILNTIFTTVKDGDTIAVRLTSPDFGGTASTTISLGSTSSVWSISTRTPTINYLSNLNIGGDCGQNASGGGGVNPAIYQAIPIKPSQNINVKYVGLSWYGGTFSTDAVPQSISIYTSVDTGTVNNRTNGTTGNYVKPGSIIATSSNISQFMKSGLSLNVSGGGTFSNFFGDSQAYFSSPVSLSGSSYYWIVAKFNTAQDPNHNGFSTVPDGMMGNAQRMVSTNGSVWTEYVGNGQCTYSYQMPNVWLTD